MFVMMESPKSDRTLVSRYSENYRDLAICKAGLMLCLQEEGCSGRIAECLATAHDLHIVHRDIKPANILFRKDGTLLLTDFGIAKQLTANKGLTTTGAMIGSPHYLSPEQAQGKAVDGRSDIYSLGVLYYEMLTGYRPFSGDSDVDIAINHVTQAVPELPDLYATYSGIIDRMTRKNPAERFPSCRSLLVALREIRDTDEWSGEIADIPLVAPCDPESTTLAVNNPAAGLILTSADASVGTLSGEVLPHETGQTAVSAVYAADTLLLDRFAVQDGKPIEHDGGLVVSAVHNSLLPHDDPDCVPTRVNMASKHEGNRDPSRRRKVFVGAFGVVMLVTAVMASLYDSTATRPAAPPATDGVAQAELDRAAIERQEKDRRAREALVASLLRDAQTAAAAYRLTTPVANSAYTYYRKVLELEPGHAKAIEGIDNIAERYYRLALSAEKDWDYPKALRLANSGLTVRPGHRPLRALMQNLKAEEGTARRALKKAFKRPKAWFK